jgi:alkylation response protein AidB-like acyl-CoA dehydrogenase
MDLRYSHDDEVFRSEIRCWLEREVPTHGPPPDNSDWPARRAYDTSWQRKLHEGGYAGLAWPADHGGRGAPISQQLVYLEEYARANAPYISVNFVGLMHAGPRFLRTGGRVRSGIAANTGGARW